MNRWKTCVIASLTCLGVAVQAHAHYLWISVKQGTDDTQVANIYFEESPHPGDGSYMDHFLGKSDVWVRTVSQPMPSAVAATEVKEGENRWMRSTMPRATEYSVDAYGKFGVYSYGKTKVLLHYYARNLSVESHDAMHELGHAEQMDFDLVPHEMGNTLEFTLLWQGKPVADRMIFIRGADGLRKNVSTDAKGRVELQRPASGNLTLRSSVEFDTPGEDDGEAYEKVRHNITLVMPL
ncbi:DUF4198 domain-containing protein [Rhodopirellula sp. JC740]|uniref:DUF4198 domain-containing protein n=1 Tax=Rhodopirellula halodulae TaxID=2894198 RepID=A0ABS8NFZ7_9BACT|nr:DUF4198 domain-containing protein [Rhodopirellula sp. JC740]MCC9642466.1 DUF4198 domain-containing protein [Rhodopirellula sp. JC740]